MTTTPTRQEAIDAAGKALAEISRELRRDRHIKARRADPKNQPQTEQQPDAA